MENHFYHIRGPPLNELFLLRTWVSANGGFNNAYHLFTVEFILFLCFFNSFKQWCVGGECIQDNRAPDIGSILVG